MMATSLVLREAPGAVFAAMQGPTKGMKGVVTNTDPDDAEATRQHLTTYQATEGIAWQAPDITLNTLFNLAASLNPMSDLELSPVQALFELLARYPLSVLLHPGVLEDVKREMVGVVRCLNFGAVMEREAFESVVQRVVEPVMEAEMEAQVAVAGMMSIPA